ncbi:MAG TPA: response regulator [Geobacteraceae bacterium]
MVIRCPSCSTSFTFADDKVGSRAFKARCSKCRTVFRVDCCSTAGVSSAQAGTTQPTKVLIAHESQAFCAAVSKVLSSDQFRAITSNDGKEALAIVEEMRPDVVLLDVALPSLYGFQVCEAIRNNPSLKDVKIILIAAIYDKTKYKRSPQSLYGADDYIEKHHIPDALVPMICRLTAEVRTDSPTADGEMAAIVSATALDRPTDPELADQEATRQGLRAEEVAATSSREAGDASGAPHDKARRLARSIVSDISLYKESEMITAARNGTFNQVMAEEIRTGRELYEARVPEDVRQGTAYLDDAFGEFVRLQQQETDADHSEGSRGKQ